MLLYEKFLDDLEYVLLAESFALSIVERADGVAIFLDRGDPRAYRLLARAAGRAILLPAGRARDPQPGNGTDCTSAMLHLRWTRRASGTSAR